MSGVAKMSVPEPDEGHAVVGRMITLDPDSPDYAVPPHERLADRYEALLDRVASALQLLEEYRAGHSPGRSSSILLDSLQEALDGPDVRDRLGLGAVCRGCGCSEHDPCPEGCGWHDVDLCTNCGEFCGEVLDLVMGRGAETRAAGQRGEG